MTQDLHTLTGPYALDALPTAEAEAFEFHMMGCAACRAEVAEFRDTAARLGEATAMSPPPHLKDSVLAQIAVTRQEAPKVVALHRRQGSGQRRFAMPAAAAIVAMAVGLGVVIGSLTSQVNDLEHREQVLAAVLARSDVVVAHGSADGVAASIVASAERGEAVITFTGLAAAPVDHTYELWMIGPNGPVPAGLFDADGAGRAIAVMRGNVTSTLSIAVTIEPAGGSDQPTTLPFLSVPLRT